MCLCAGISVYIGTNTYMDFELAIKRNISLNSYILDSYATLFMLVSINTCCIMGRRPKLLSKFCYVMLCYVMLYCSPKDSIFHFPDVAFEM